VGAVIESHLDPREGPVASILIKTGTLHVGDVVIVGQTYGKVRTMKDYLGRRIKEAIPGTPVRISGLNAVPNFGDVLREVSSEKEAKELISKMQKFLSVKKLTTKKIGLGEIAGEIKKGELKELKIILKAVSQGALEALRSSLENLSTATIKVNIIHAAVGDINESDVLMAKTAGALVVGFKVKILPVAFNTAENQGVKISLYEIIYQLLDDVKDALSGLIEPEFVEVTVGRLKVLAIFKRGKKGRIVGGKVEEGELRKGLAVRIWRKKELIGTGKITSLQRDKQPVDEVKLGYECGVGLDCPVECPEIEEGDILEAYKLEEQIRRVK
jgi:translation initiation factor IF-2